MGGRIVILDRAIARAGDDLAVQHQSRADRRLAPRGGGARLGEGAVPGIDDVLENQMHVDLFPARPIFRARKHKPF